MRIKKYVAALLLLALCVTLSACGGNSDAESESRAQKITSTAMTVGDISLNALEFQIYFHEYYNKFLSSSSGGSSYGLNSQKALSEQTCAMQGYTDKTWAQYFADSTLEYCKELFSIIQQANKESYSMTEEENGYFANQMETLKASVKSDAAENKQSEQASLATLYGDDVTYDDVEAAYKNISLYTSYINAKTVKDYTEDELNAYYAENSKNIDALTLRVAPMYYVTDSSQNNSYNFDEQSVALSKANEFVSKITSEQSFIELLPSYINQNVSSYYGETDYTLTKGVTYSKFSNDPEGADWAFSKDRVEGDVGIINTGSSYLVIYYISRDTRDYNYVDVRDILIKDTSDEGLKKAQEIYDTWLAGEKTEQSFSSLATEKSEDTGSNTNGGLYTSRKKGDFVAALNDWLYADGRQTGDTGIIKGTYGYYILYMSKIGDNVRKSLITTALNDSAYTALINEIIPQYQTTNNMDSILSVVK